MWICIYSLSFDSANVYPRKGIYTDPHELWEDIGNILYHQKGDLLFVYWDKFEKKSNPCDCLNGKRTFSAKVDTEDASYYYDDNIEEVDEKEQYYLPRSVYENEERTEDKYYDDYLVKIFGIEIVILSSVIAGIGGLICCIGGLILSVFILKKVNKNYVA